MGERSEPVRLIPSSSGGTGIRGIRYNDVVMKRHIFRISHGHAVRRGDESRRRVGMSQVLKAE